MVGKLDSGRTKMDRALLFERKISKVICVILAERGNNSKYGVLGWNELAVEPHLEEVSLSMGNPTSGGIVSHYKGNYFIKYLTR